jgi:integrase
MCVGFRHALRISEVLSLDKSNVYDGKLIVQRKKKSDKTTQMLVLSPDDPLFDETPILVLAETCNGKFFPITRQAVDLAVKGYAKIAGIHKDKAHFHALGKHSMAMQLWELTHSLGHIKSYLGHKAMSSTMCYLNEADSMIAQKAVAGLFTKGA